MSKPKVIVLEGPTAVGKTELSIELAKRINGEIISADSMQIYKYMDIGTAKVNVKERQGIKHYLLDIVEPNERYSVANFRIDALKTIKKILSKGKVPIVVGGTGLYIDTLIYNIKYPEIEVNLKYREELEEQIQKNGMEYLYNKAKEIDEEAVKKISPNDKKRIMRILEIYHQTGKNKTTMEIESRKEEPPYEYIVFALQMDREKLYQRINKRVDLMIEQGLIKEVEDILEKYKIFPTAMQGLGYKEVVEYLNGQDTKEDMIDKIKMETRRYAKRQMTWFRKNEDIKWLEAALPIEENIKMILEEYCG